MTFDETMNHFTQKFWRGTSKHWEGSSSSQRCHSIFTFFHFQLVFISVVLL